MTRRPSIHVAWLGLATLAALAAVDTMAATGTRTNAAASAATSASSIALPQVGLTGVANPGRNSEPNPKSSPNPEAVLRVDAGEPRAYGYQVGDVVQRQVRVHAPAGWRLDEASLPRPGGRGQALELRRVVTRNEADGGGQRHDLALEYQVFLSPPAVRTLEIAPFRLRFDAAARSEDVLVEAWPVTVAPLAPVAVSPRRGLGDMQPDREPPRIDTTSMRSRLVACAALAAALLGWLAVQAFGPPWRAARQQPFAMAWRALRHLPPAPAEAQWRSACRDFHAALNRHAGEVLFEPGLARFVAERPAYRALHDDLAHFMRLSRNAFFAGAPIVRGDAAWLLELCRRCHEAERGLGPGRRDPR
jgi:mxaA protein